MSNERKVIDLQRLQRFKEHLQDFGRETESIERMWRGLTSQSTFKAIYDRASAHVGRPIIWDNNGTPMYVDTRLDGSDSHLVFSCVSQGVYYAWTIDADGHFSISAGTSGGGLPLPAIVDNLTTIDATKALSANQGKVLKSLIDNASIEAKYFMFDLLPVRGSGNPVTSDGLYTMKQDLQGSINLIMARLQEFEDVVNVDGLLCCMVDAE